MMERLERLLGPRDRRRRGQRDGGHADAGGALLVAAPLGGLGANDRAEPRAGEGMPAQSTGDGTGRLAPTAAGRAGAWSSRRLMEPAPGSEDALLAASRRWVSSWPGR